MVKMCLYLLQYTIAMMGYANEEETTVLELTYNYGVTENTRGNAYAQVSADCIMSGMPYFLLTPPFDFL